MIEVTACGHYRDVMNALLRPCLLVALSMLSAGCSLPEVQTSLEGPSFVLTSDEPVAAFEVTLCLEGSVPKELFVSGSLTADVRTSGEAATLRLESQSDRPMGEGSESVEVSRQGAELFLWLEAEGPWKDGGQRCSTPEVVEFSAEGLAQGESLEVEAWAVSMEVEFQTRVFGGDGPDDGDLSVQIERL